MKKIIIGVVAALVISMGVAYSCYRVAYGGADYYVQITNDGKKETQRDDSGKLFDQYRYSMTAYDKSGNAKQLNFIADHQLRKGAYLDLTVNDKKGVTSWKEVENFKLPDKAKFHLDY